MRRLPLLATLGLLLVPALAVAQDGDQDGVPDAADAFPCDATRAAVAFAPAEGVYGTLMFEDHWPQAGDLDFNDVVLAYHAAYALDGAGRTVALRLTLFPRAIGGTFASGLGLQLPVATEAVRSVTRTVGTASQALQPSAVDTQLTVRVTDNLRELFGGANGAINSRTDVARLAGQAVTIDVDFSSPVTLDASAAPHDLYIFRTDDPSHEIHQPAYSGTASMNAALFATADDASSPGRSFVDAAGLPFALRMPDLAAHPAEFVAISDLFPSITTFAASGGVQAADFYTGPVTSAAYRDVNGAPAPAPGPVSAWTVDSACVNPFQGNALVDLRFADDSNAGTLTVGVLGRPTLVAAGGRDGGGYAAGLSNNANCYDNADIPVGASSGSHTFSAWYRGTQTNSSARPYQTGVLIFGDQANSVWIGLGVDNGYIAIANGNVSRGRTFVADGGWHHLAWVRTGNRWDLYVDGNLEVAGYSATGSTRNQYIRRIGCGYPYGGTTSPSAIDDVLVLDTALSADEVRYLFDPTAPLPLCTDGIQNGTEAGVDCGGSRCAPCPVTPILDIDFDNGVFQPRGGVSATNTGVSLAASGGWRNGGYANGFARNGRVIDIADQHVGNGGQNTFSAWYRGSQTNTSARPYQTGVLIFGDPAGSVYIGLGLDQGRVAIANGSIVRGTTNVADGQWHHLAWARTGSTWQAFVDGRLEVNGFRATASPGNQYIRLVGGGYPYGGTASPTALDEVRIYDAALNQAGITELATP